MNSINYKKIFKKLVIILCGLISGIILYYLTIIIKDFDIRNHKIIVNVNKNTTYLVDRNGIIYYKKLITNDTIHEFFYPEYTGIDEEIKYVKKLNNFNLDTISIKWYKENSNLKNISPKIGKKE